MGEEPLVNKLSIYLIKSEFSALDQLIEGDFERVSVGRGLALCTTPSYNRKPDWLQKFFVALDLNNLNIFTAAAKAVLIVEGVGKDNRTFAISFGYGKHMLRPGVIEERFGLKTTINIVDQDNLRSIDKTSLESVPIHSREQISQDGSKEAFGLNIEQDLVRAISGKVRTGYEIFGKIVSGKDALYIAGKVDTSNIVSFLQQCLERYQSEDYKANFDWIDQIAEIKDRILISQLDEKLVENLQADNRDKLWMATPEEIEWSEIQGFTYRNLKPPVFEDLHLSNLIDLFGSTEITLNKLKHTRVFAVSALTDTEKYKWSLYQCMYFETEKAGHTYMLTNGKWYEIDKNFVDSVNRYYTAIPRSTISFPDYTDAHGNEKGYNRALTEAMNGVCFDADNISYGGGHSKIEFCDVYSKDKILIHVKHYSGSSTLSHLFSQGAVSGEIYISDPEFRLKVNEKMRDDLKLPDPEARYRPNGQKVVFAVIARNQGDLEIPFFSKVSLRNARNRLAGFDYSLEIAKILNTSTKTKGKSRT